MNTEETRIKLREEIADLINHGLSDQEIVSQLHLLGSGITIAMGHAPIQEDELVAIIRDLMHDGPHSVDEGEVQWLVKCPRCGNTDVAKLRYIEDIQCFRDVRRLSPETDTLTIDGAYATGEGYDDGTGGRFECHNSIYDKLRNRTDICGREFPIPEDISLDFE